MSVVEVMLLSLGRESVCAKLASPEPPVPPPDPVVVVTIHCSFLLFLPLTPESCLRAGKPCASRADSCLNHVIRASGRSAACSPVSRFGRGVAALRECGSAAKSLALSKKPNAAHCPLCLCACFLRLQCSNDCDRRQADGSRGNRCWKENLSPRR